MGLSHRKKLRRHIEFYQTSFGFYEPFKILVDGNLLHQVEHMKQGDVFEVVQNGFGRRVKLFCTSCVLNELRSLGSEFATTAAAAEDLDVHKCGHTTSISAADCLISCIGDVNMDHWWIGTQDRKLRETLNVIPGVPCLFLTYSGLFVETPSDASRKAAKKAQDEGLTVAEWELSTDALKNLNELSRQPTSSIFRKRKTKGPNPLSCLKKKESREAQPDEEMQTKRKRKRRKSKSHDLSTIHSAEKGPIKRPHPSVSQQQPR